MQDTAKIEAVEAAINGITETKVSIPEAVTKFCDSIDHRFSSTVDNLLKTAKRMHEIATSLEHRAQELKNARTDVTGVVAQWTSYERESDSIEKFYRALFDK